MKGGNMTLIVIILAVLVLLWVTKFCEDHLGEDEKFDLFTVEEPKRGQFTRAGGRANT